MAASRAPRHQNLGRSGLTEQGGRAYASDFRSGYQVQGILCFFTKIRIWSMHWWIFKKCSW